MASGSFSSGGQLNIEIDWSSAQNGQNSSWVAVNLYAVCEYRLNYSAKKYGSITINGSTYNFSSEIGAYGPGKYLVASYGITVGHDNNGLASIGISATYGIQITYSDVWVPSLSTSGTAALDMLYKSAPSNPDWGPSISKYIADPGDSLFVNWGAGGSLGMSGAQSASLLYYEVQWNFSNTSWGAVWNGSAYNFYTNMPSIGRGGTVQFRMRVWNNYARCSNWAYSSYVVENVLPIAPTSVTGFPINFEPGTPVTFSWAGASGGSYPISSYHVQTSTDGGTTWTDLDPAHTTNSIISSAFTTRGQKIQVRVNVKNTGGYISAWAYSNVLTCNNAPTTPASITVPSLVYLSNPNVYFACSGAASGAGNITEYNFDIQDTAGGGWINVYQGLTAGCAINLSSFLTLTPEHTLQVRARIRNSYGVYSSYLVSSNIIVQGGIAHIKENGVWKTGIVYVRVAGVWKQAVSVYVNESGVWRSGL